MIRCNNCGWYNPDTATHCEMCDESLAGIPKVEMPVVSQEEEGELSSKEEKPGVKEEVSSDVIAEEPVSRHEKPSKSSPLSATIRFASIEREADRKSESTYASPEKTKPDYAATVMDASALLKSAEPVHCPKCRYPVLGGEDTCPNCGASLKTVSTGASSASESSRESVLPDRPVQPEEKSGKPRFFGRPVDTLKEAPENEHQVSPQFKQTIREFSNPGVAGQVACSKDKADKRQQAPRPTVRDLRATIREIPAELLGSSPEKDKAAFYLHPIDCPDAGAVELKPGEIVTIEGKRYRFVQE